jgi:NAD(P)-dependent dehydrogenase (short-subunit alcohol dehydrogenase family)
MGRLDGKVAVILGASDPRSMGAATAARFTKEGAKIVVAARRADALQPLVDQYGAVAVACDVTKDADLAKLADTAIAKFGRLDAAINYAGVNVGGPLAEVTEEQLNTACAVHFVGTALFFKQMGRVMADGGAMVTTSTLTALAAPPGLAAYAGSKKGADQIVRIAAVEYGPRGIRVNSIAPGFTKTAMTAPYLGVPGLEKAFLKETPLGRLPTVDDIANVALWLASDEAFVTGQVIDVTGGTSLRRMPTYDEMT